MSVFGHPKVIDESLLRSLHLGSHIAWPRQPKTAFQVMEEVEMVDDVVSDEIRHGINNLPLLYLCIALLEIAHWKLIDSAMIPQDE
jgi:hypothetical protein